MNNIYLVLCLFILNPCLSIGQNRLEIQVVNLRNDNGGYDEKAEKYTFLLIC